MLVSKLALHYIARYLLELHTSFRNIFETSTSRRLSIQSLTKASSDSSVVQPNLNGLWN